MEKESAEYKHLEILEEQRNFFRTGQTRGLRERTRALKALKKAIKNHEPELQEALAKDLKRSDIEAFVSEIALLYDEIDYCLNQLPLWMRTKSYAANIAFFPSEHNVIPRPKGQVLIISPWNYPILLLLSPLIGAISAGNTVVLKPSELAPHCEQIITKLISSTFKPEYIAVLSGEGHKVVPPIIGSRKVQHVFFTGSVPVGRIIGKQCAKELISCTLELGGKSPAIVDETAKLSVSAKRIAWTKFFNCGQTCVAPDYLLVHKSVEEKLKQEIKKAVHEFYGNDPLQSDYYGKIINEKQFNRLKGYLEEQSHLEHISNGDALVEESLYIAPTLAQNVDMENKLMQEEIFGPILPIIPYEHDDEIESIIAQNPEPLALYVFSENKSFRNKVMENIPFGGGGINSALIHLTSCKAPFGGVGTSGMGNYHGQHSFSTFSHYQTVSKSATWLELKMKYPPYSTWVKKMIKMLFR